MKTKYNSNDSEEMVEIDISSDDAIKIQKNIANNLKLLNNRNISNNDFINKDNGKILNLDYIPKELFSSFKNKTNEENNINQNDQNNIKDNDIYNFNYGSNNFSSIICNDKNKEIKSSQKNDNNNDFKISQNEINISQSYNKNDNILNSDIKSNNQDINSNLHLPENLSKEVNSNKRYNEELNYDNMNDKNINLNSNIPNNNNINIENNNNIISNESSTLRHNLSNYNAMSDNFINSYLNISNSIANNSNILSNQNNNYLDKIKIRELEKKEQYLFELENKRNKNISDIIEKQKVEFDKKIKDIENMNNNINEKFFVEKENMNINNKNFSPDKNIQNINNNANINIEEKNYENKNNIIKNNEIFSYFNQMNQENNKHTRNSNFSANFNNRTSSSFYTKGSKIFSPYFSTTLAGINKFNNNKILNQNFTPKNIIKREKQQKPKSTNKLISSNKNVSNSSSHIIKSLRSNDYNQQSSLRILNSLKKYNKEESQIINKESVKKQIRKKSLNYNIKGKKNIQEKYNIYFNCFMPDLYEEQKKKLLNEKNVKKSKSTTKIKKLEDYVGPNLYNEQVEIPDFGYICYKTNKKINPNYSLNQFNTYHNYNYNFGSTNRLNTLQNGQNRFSSLNINTRNICNDYENDKNNYENESDILNYLKGSNHRNRNRNDNIEEMYHFPKTEYNNEIMNEIYYHDLYNKAFKQIKYPSNDFYEKPLFC